MENLKLLKVFTNLFSNKGEYLFYSEEENIWYFITDVTKEGLQNNNTSNIVLSEVKFLNNFKELITNAFDYLFDIIKQKPNNYFISLKAINSFLNKNITAKNKDNKIPIEEALINVQLNIKDFIKLIKSKTDTDSFVTVDLQKKDVENKGVTFIDVKKSISLLENDKIKNVFVPFKNGYCVNSSFMKLYEEDEFYLKLYTSNCQTYSYSIVYKNKDVEVESIQPFHIFINN